MTFFSKKKMRKKAFRVELPDKYAFPGNYPGSKDYIKPPREAVIDALVNRIICKRGRFFWCI